MRGRDPGEVALAGGGRAGPGVWLGGHSRPRSCATGTLIDLGPAAIDTARATATSASSWPPRAPRSCATLAADRGQQDS